MPSRPSGSREERRQTRAARGVAQEAVIGLLRTTDMFRRRLTALLEPHRITPQQYNVLRILRGAGPAGLPTLEIATRMIEQAPGITRLLDRLEAKRLVRRERCPTDRRQVTCRITDGGLACLSRLQAAVDALDERVVGPLPPAERRELVRLLDRVRLGLDRG